jgi:hypothetical protein
MSKRIIKHNSSDMRLTTLSRYEKPNSLVICWLKSLVICWLNIIGGNQTKSK